MFYSCMSHSATMNPHRGDTLLPTDKKHLTRIQDIRFFRSTAHSQCWNCDRRHTIHCQWRKYLCICCMPQLCRLCSSWIDLSIFCIYHGKDSTNQPSIRGIYRRTHKVRIHWWARCRVGRVYWSWCRSGLSRWCRRWLRSSWGSDREWCKWRIGSRHRYRTPCYNFYNCWKMHTLSIWGWRNRILGILHYWEINYLNI